MLCNLCGREFDGAGNNPEPLNISSRDRCCDACNLNYVLPARIYALKYGLTDEAIIACIHYIRTTEGND